MDRTAIQRCVVSQSPGQSVSRSVSRSVGKSLGQLGSRPVCRSTSPPSQAVSRLFGRSFSQAVSRSVSRFVVKQRTTYKTSVRVFPQFVGWYHATAFAVFTAGRARGVHVLMNSVSPHTCKGIAISEDALFSVSAL